MARPFIGKLGKLPPVHRPGALMLAAYLPAKHVPVPETVDNYSCLQHLGMMLNDQLGDCTCAGYGHAVQSWTAKNGHEVVIPDDVILAAYEAVGGYVPGDPATDQGAVEADVLDYAMKTGFGGHTLDSYAVIETHSEYQMKLAMYLFGAVYTGLALPESCQDQTLWAVVNGPAGEPGSLGGHAVPLVGYDAHTATCITWGAPLKMTWAFQRRYMDEAYALLSHDWLDEKSQKAPNLLDWDTLKSDLQKQFRRA
jgi:hypothetical protein